MNRQTALVPVFNLYIDNRHVASLFDPQREEMFWCSYRVEPVDGAADVAIRDEAVWKGVAFTIRDADGNEPNPNTFTGGYADFCHRKTQRLTFRSLWPPE